VRIALLGLGLIGGSVARAVRGPGWQVVAWSPAGTGPARALAQGAIDEAAPSMGEAVRGADLVLLAAPPHACLGLLEALASEVGRDLGSDTVISDVASTKVALLTRAAGLGLRFVGGHPMAGRESSGFDAADADLFRGRPWVVVPGAARATVGEGIAPATHATPAAGAPDEAAVARVEALARACGAIPVRMSATEHDDAVAAISHAPLVLAAALVEAMAGGPGEAEPPGWPAARALAAGGWASATRLARGDPTMGAGIARTNAQPLAAHLADVRDRLDEWIGLLEASGADGMPDGAALQVRFTAARERLEGDA
jgi:prephenate dehydrogenase